MPAPTTAATAAPAPTPTATPAAPPAVEVPVRPDVRPPVIRVLLQTPPVPTFPEPGRRYACVANGRVELVRGPLLLRAHAGGAALQVGAFARPENAHSLVARLAAMGFKTETRKTEELSRVVVLGGEGESEGDLAARLKRAGFGEAPQPAGTVGGSLRLTGEDGQTVTAAQFRLVPLDDVPVRVGGKAVRGEFLLRVAESGVNVVNVVNLEEYLRGVVPAEMGPHSLPAVEALKAQAVAARTYAAAHLGEHDADGYDTCDTTSCQVYGGADAETALSDAAVRETAGEILTFGGKPIDALYHSTCAGRTEDGAAVFPGLDAPYLKGVPCRGEREVALGSEDRPGPWLGPVEHLIAVAEAVAGQLGVVPRPQALASRFGGAQAGPGVAGLARAFALGRGGVLLHLPEREIGESDVLELLRVFRLPVPQAEGDTPRWRWELAVVVRLAQLSGALRTVAGRIVPGPRGVQLVTEPPDEAHDVTAPRLLLERSGERWRRAAIRAAAGSPATVWLVGDACVAVEVEPLPHADARSAWNSWVRELPLDEIARRLGVTAVSNIAVTRWGVSGRVLAVELATPNGPVELAAYPFRLKLELPDTLFVVMIRPTPHGDVARFFGRGWGHGVGMCQNGAYGMALGGAGYQEILRSYYTGVQIERWAAEPREKP